jgi:hypothetical protein
MSPAPYVNVIMVKIPQIQCLLHHPASRQSTMYRYKILSVSFTDILAIFIPINFDRKHIE